MKKLLTVLLTVMIAFTTFGVNILAETENVEEKVEEVALAELPAAEEEKTELPEEVVEVLEVETPAEEKKEVNEIELATVFKLSVGTVYVGNKVSSINPDVSVAGVGKDAAYYKGVQIQYYSTKDKKWYNANNGDSINDVEYRAIITIKKAKNGNWKNNEYPFASNLSVTLNDVALDAGVVKHNNDNSVTITCPITVVKKVSVPTLKKNSLPYTGEEITVEFNGDGKNYSIVSGNKATDVGEHKVVLKIDEGCVWNFGDGKTSTENQEVTWNITPKMINIPQATNKTYDGTEQTGLADGTGYTVVSGGVGTDADNYTAVVQLASTNYIWFLGMDKGQPITSTENQEVAWKINRKAVKLDLNKDAHSTDCELRTNKNSSAEIKVYNYEDGMKLEYSLSNKINYVELPVTLIDGEAYIYLSKPVERGVSYRVRVKDAGNYTHEGHASANITMEVPMFGDAYVVSDSEMTEGDSSATIKCTRDMEMDRVYSFEFLTIVLGDETVTLEKDVDYTVEPGSTLVTFKESFLDTLAVGEYEVGFHYSDGVHIEGKLVVNPKPTPTPKKPTFVAPKTGVR